MKQKKLATLTIAALITFTACVGTEAAIEEIPERIIPVNVQAVSTGTISSQLSYAGQVRAAEQVAIMSRLQGMVDQVFVDTGDFVNAGDILFTMDPVDIQNNIDSLTAQLATANAGVSAAQTGVAQARGGTIQQQILQAEGGVSQAASGITQAESGISQAETAVIQAETNIEQAALSRSQAEIARNTAQQGYDDTRALFNSGVATRMQMDQAEMSLSNAQITLDQATNSYNLAHTALAQAESSLAQAQANLAQAQSSHQQAVQSHQLISGAISNETAQRAQDGLSQAIAQRDSLAVNLQAARERLDDAAIRSPISGVIGSRNVEPQTMLVQGAAFTVVSTDTVNVSVEVTEIIINSIQVGQEVYAHITAAADTPFRGTVATVSPAANLQTSTFTVDVSVDNSAGIIRPGMFAEVFFTREQAENVVVIPRSAVLIEDGEPVVYLNNNGNAERRPVSLGIDTGEQIQITSGLSIGEPLIVTGQTFVTNGVQLLIVD